MRKSFQKNLLVKAKCHKALATSLEIDPTNWPPSHHSLNRTYRLTISQPAMHHPILNSMYIQSAMTFLCDTSKVASTAPGFYLRRLDEDLLLFAVFMTNLRPHSSLVLASLGACISIQSITQFPKISLLVSLPIYDTEEQSSIPHLGFTT